MFILIMMMTMKIYTKNKIFLYYYWLYILQNQINNDK